MSRSWVRRGVVAFAMAAALGMVAFAGPASAHPDVLAQSDGSASTSIEVVGIDPLVLAPGQDLTVRVRVTNRGSGPIASPTVLVRLNRSGFLSRSSLDRWRTAGPGTSLGALVASADVAEPISAGAARTVTVTVPADEIQLPTNSWSWGARGLTVQLVDQADPAGDHPLTRFLVIWFPDQEVERTSVSVLVPLVGPVPGEDSAETVAALTAPDGRLGRVVSATEGSPGVTWAVDTWLLDEADVASADDGSSGDPSWTDSVVEAADGREVVLLPWADADVSALVHDGADSLLDEAAARAAEEAEGFGLDPTADLMLPGGGVGDLEVAARAVRSGQALVVAPGALPSPTVLTYTPSGRTTITTAAGDATVLVPDERLSSALTYGAVLPDVDPAPTPAVASADLLAELAVITRERPVDARHMLVTVPRDWEVDADVAEAQLAALAEAPFVRFSSVSDLITEPTTTADRGTLPATVVGGGEVDAATLDAVEATVVRRQELASMVADPDALLGDVQGERLRVAALAWRTDVTGRDRMVQASTERTEDLNGAVSVPGGSTLNLVSSSGDLPIQVVNSLDQDVTLDVRLRPSDGRLVARQTVTITVPARGEATAAIPVHGVQSADVTAAVELYTPTGVLVDDSTSLNVRVRAEWESIGTAVVGALFAVALVAGLTRTIRRGSVRGRAESS